MEREGPKSDFATTGRFARLFMFPGVAHCAGGTGPDRFDFMPLLTAWVEQGAAPTQVIASRAPDAVPKRSRPVCVYPMVARYKGSGDTNAAENFVCAKPS